MWDGIIPAVRVLGMSSTDLPHPREHILLGCSSEDKCLTEQTAAFVIPIPQPWEGLILEYLSMNILSNTCISSEGEGEERRGFERCQNRGFDLWWSHLAAA